VTAGTWLWRQRRSAESRVPLRAAAETFEALGAVPWRDRAWQDLRASGATLRRLPGKTFGHPVRYCGSCPARPSGIRCDIAAA